MPLLSVVSMEYDLTASSTRRCRKTLCDNLCLRESELIEYGVQKFVELLRLTTKNSSLLVNHTLVEKVHGNLNHSSTSTLAVTCLEEPKLALLNGKLHVLHIAIVLLELVLKCVKFLIKLRHSLFHRRIVGSTLFL